MRLLVYCPVFLPHVGGLEICTAQIAGEIAKSGHEVVVVTSTPGPTEARDCPYSVVRRPGAREFLRWVRWCDVFYQANVSLRGLWPLLFARRPWVVSHHGWYARPDRTLAWQDRLKRFLIRFAEGSISVSSAVAADLRTPSVIIANPYRDALFRRMPSLQRTGELLFVGRLVSDKGVDLLLEALAILASRGSRPGLTIAGEGPERLALEAQARHLGIESQVAFVGVKNGDEVARLMNEHRVLVVPSRYDEPFGIVALEGIACGCQVVGSEGGGLREAIGPCGRTFPNGDAEALSRALSEVLANEPDETVDRRALVDAHLRRHDAVTVANQYLEILGRALRAGGTSALPNPSAGR